MEKKRFALRLVSYFFGLFIMTIGIALSVISNLGVSPVSSIPYTMTCVLGVEMGNATIIFHVVLVIIQIILLRKEFKAFLFLQIPVGIIFGKFTTISNVWARSLPISDHMINRILLIIASTILVAIGIFFYLPANIIPLAGEGVMQATSKVTGIEFSKVKMGFDITMVVISLTVCLITLHSPGSVGFGTAFCAVFVGVCIGILNRKFGKKRDQFLYGNLKKE